ncbi:hypothetical protein Tco_0831255 [Tanacetum coccineum]
MSWFLRCSWCGGPFNGGNCRCCTNVSFEDEFVRNPDPISYDETPDFSYPPPQPHTYSCELCGNDSYYDYDCPPRKSRRTLTQQRKNEECIKSHNDMIESRNELFKTMQSLFGMLREQAANLSTHTPEPSRRFNSICYDDEESTILLNAIISQIPPSIAITPVLPTMEPEDSLIMGNEDVYLRRDNSVTFSNPLLDSNDDFTSSDDESLPAEDIQEENFKIYSNPLFEFDDEYISSDVNPLFNEVLEDIDECFDPGGDIDEIDAFLDIDVSTNIEDGYHDSEGDIIHLESLLFNDTTHNLPLEVFLDHDPRSLKDERDNDDLKSMVKVFDPRIHEKNISPTYVRLPFEDRYYFSLTFVIKIFLPFLTYLVNSLPLLSSGSEDLIFDPGISAYSFYSLEPVAYGSPMKVFPFFCFCPKDKGIRGDPSVGHASLSLVCGNVFAGFLKIMKTRACFQSSNHPVFDLLLILDGGLNTFVEIPSGEIKVHIEVLPVLWGNRLPILDGSLPLSR